MPVSRLGLGIDQATNDLHLDGDGNLVMVEDALAVGQHVRQRLMTYEGEWFLDTQAGVPWLEQIMGRQPDLQLAEAVMKAEIADTDGVTAIEEFSIRFFRGNRQLDVPRATVLTEYDERVSL